jgi:phage-related baseplate assembly protein
VAKIEELKHLPEINFVETDVETMLSEAIEEYEQAYFDKTGKIKNLADGDPVRIWIYSQVLKLYHAYMLIEDSAKQNLLNYSKGDNLENLGARIGVKRDKGKKSITTMKLTLSSPQNKVISIPKGTRFTPGNQVYFKTLEYDEIPELQTEYNIIAECTEAGFIGNNFQPGQINILVDPLPYVKSVENIDVSEGGEDVESDESLTRKIYLKPESFSTAGPELAYNFFVLEYSSKILDVSVVTPAPGVVDIRFILENGEIPNESLLNEVKDYVSDKKRRPLTDKVNVYVPESVEYNIDFKYYISNENEKFAETIKKEVEKAVEEFIIWQKTKIGRDINPSELSYLIKKAGAKRVEIKKPTFKKINEIEIAKESQINVIYGGLEYE